MSNQCEGCAFKNGSEAFNEPHNRLMGLICVMTPHTFYCHEGLDWKNDEKYKNITPQQLKAMNPIVCQGWRESVEAMAKTGYYKDFPQVTKLYGELALRNLEGIKNEKHAGKKAGYWRDFRTLMKELTVKFRKYMKKLPEDRKELLCPKQDT